MQTGPSHTFLSTQEEMSPIFFIRFYLFERERGHTSGGEGQRERETPR